MKFLNASVALTLIVSISSAPTSQAGDGPTPSGHFHSLLNSALANSVAASDLGLLHMPADRLLSELSKANSIDDAIAIAKPTTLGGLIKDATASTVDADVDSALEAAPLTLVILPGVFGEFIPNRPFEEIISRPSAEADAFRAAVKAAGVTDRSYDLKSMTEKERSLEELVHVGAIKSRNGRTGARVVLFNTPFMSLESLGDARSRAQIFGRRLGKYLELTGPQKIALVGYSRGTILGLEMLASAEKRGDDWLKSVVAMVSFGGVVWGSALADDTEDPASPTKAMIDEVKELRNAVDPNSRAKTVAAWSRFAVRNLGSVAGLGAAPPGVDGSVDLAAPRTLVTKFWWEFGLNRPITDFANNVRRFQIAIDAALNAVGELTTRSRLEWWRTKTLPKSVTYVSLSAAMADPDLGGVDKRAFESSLGYARRSRDDMALLQNRRQYEKLSGLALNDSQVSVPQSIFLADAAARLNAKNDGMRTLHLGVLGTHHWGLALAVVNPMADKRVNPLPREAILKALAAQIAIESTRQAR